MLSMSYHSTIDHLFVFKLTYVGANHVVHVSTPPLVLLYNVTNSVFISTIPQQQDASPWNTVQEAFN